MNHHNTGGAEGKAVLRHLAEALVPYLRQHLNPSESDSSGYYTQKNSPLGRRKHMNLVRRGVLPGHKVGKTVFILRANVHAYIQCHSSLNQAAENEQRSEHELGDWGLTPRGHQ